MWIFTNELNREKATVLLNTNSPQLLYITCSQEQSPMCKSQNVELQVIGELPSPGSKSWATGRWIVYWKPLYLFYSWYNLSYVWTITLPWHPRGFQIKGPLKRNANWVEAFEAPGSMNLRALRLRAEVQARRAPVMAPTILDHGLSHLLLSHSDQLAVPKQALSFHSTVLLCVPFCPPWMPPTPFCQPSGHLLTWFSSSPGSSVQASPDLFREIGHPFLGALTRSWTTHDLNPLLLLLIHETFPCCCIGVQSLEHYKCPTTGRKEVGVGVRGDQMEQWILVLFDVEFL